MTHYLEFEDDKSSKFWMIELDGNSHTVTYGKIGSEGRTSTKEFDSPEEAQKSNTIRACWCVAICAAIS